MKPVCSILALSVDDALPMDRPGVGVRGGGVTIRFF